MRTYVWLFISLLFIVASFLSGQYWHTRYFSIPAGSLPFALGALIFFIKDKPLAIIPKSLLAVPWALFICLVFIAVITSYAITQQLPLWAMECIFYICLLISFLLILSLAQGKPFINCFPKRLDQLLGEYSYPFYLMHYQVTIIVSYILYSEVSNFKGQLTITTLTLVFLLLSLLSYTSNKLIEKPISNLRKKFRSANRN